MNMDHSSLLQPFIHGKLELKNRIVMPPMVTNYASAEGFVTEQTRNHYEERAKGGAGLVIVEATCVDAPAGKGFRRGLHIDDDKFIPGLSELADTVRQHGAKIGIQLHHVGAQALFNVTGVPPVGPSVLPSPEPVPEEKAPRELSVEEIEELVQCYAKAALRAKTAGFDCVQMHAAHFYLIAQFLSPFMNLRTDSYGGTLENRARFLFKIINATRELVGKDYPILCRIDAEQLRVDDGINESPEIARIAQEAGADMIDISVCGIIYATPPKTKPDQDLEHFPDDFKRNVSVPIIFGGAMDYSTAARLISENKIDLATLGRSLIIDPHLPNKISSGKTDDIVPCIDCRVCLESIMNKTGSLECSKGREKGAGE